MEFTGQEGGGDVGAASPPRPLHCSIPANGSTGTPAEARRQYHECLRNHAAAAGGHVVDGCCEFMPASPDDPLTCAACGCHRSFHRRDPSPGHAGAGAQLPLLVANTRSPVLLPPPASKRPQHRLTFPYRTPSGGAGTTTESSSEERRGPGRRSRTTFTREQKEQMLAFAERVGWRIQRQDEATMEQFCAQVGVRRQVLKVWMHNNKHSNTIRRQQREQRQEQQQ